jgi:beta-xylosidase
VNKVNEKTMHDLYQATVQKTEYLREHGFQVIETWECEINRELKRDEEMKEYFDNYDLTDPLEPRHAFYGGRTNATKLFHECKDDEEIRYVREKRDRVS